MTTPKTNFVQDITDFHVKFKLAYRGKPRRLNKELSDFRIKFLQEELDEYVRATTTGDLAGQFDALIDLCYVALGTAHLHGFDFEEGWRRVQAANMAKVRAKRAADSKRGTTYDVVKPAGWKPPTLKDLV